MEVLKFIYLIVGLVISKPLKDNEVLDKYHLRLCTFNVQIFGISKMSDQSVVDVLINIFEDFDLCVMQEIRDSSESAFPELINQLNTNSKYPNSFNGTAASRQGRSSSKEQYAFIWRTDKLNFNQIWEFQDTYDYFERPPAVGIFNDIKTNYQINFLNIHTKPDDTISEINALINVFTEFSKLFNTNEMILAGDMNADCTYLPASKWGQVNTYLDQQFYWEVSTYANTTVADKNCAYDRVITTGKETVRIVRDAFVYKYNWVLPNIDNELTKKISDHYPVGFNLYPLESKAAKKDSP